MKEMKKSFFLIASFIFTLFSCTEKIDLDLDTSSVRLVVEANLTDQPGPYLVRIATTAPYYAEGLLPVVSEAVVTISDGDTTVRLVELEPGDYYTPAGYTGEPGKTYRLAIRLKEEIAGTKDYSAVAVMPQKAPTDSCNVIYEPDLFKGMWQIRWYAQDPSGPNAYLFRAYRNGQPVTDSLRRWSAIDDQFFDGNYTMGIGVLYFFKNRRQYIYEGDTIVLEVCNITSEYQKFVMFLKDEVQSSNPLFSPPPANVPGNISNGGLGYFAAYPVQYVQTVCR